MKEPRPYLSLTDRKVYRRIEDVVGCKWSVAVLAAVGSGVTRPGQLERYIPGISAKVLRERLRRLVDFNLLDRTETPGRVPRVDYALTTTGRRLAKLLRELRTLDDSHQQHHTGTERAITPPPAGRPNRVGRGRRESDTRGSRAAPM